MFDLLIDGCCYLGRFVLQGMLRDCRLRRWLPPDLSFSASIIEEEDKNGTPRTH